MAGTITIDTGDMLGKPAVGLAYVSLMCESPDHEHYYVTYDADENCPLCQYVKDRGDVEGELKKEIESLTDKLRLAQYDLEAERTEHNKLKLDTAEYLEQKRAVEEAVKGKL